MTVREEKFEIKLPMFNGTVGEDSQHWELRFKTTLRGWDLIDALIEDAIDKTSTQKALSIMISALGDNPLKAIQECETTYSALQKLHHIYAGRSFINQLSALKHLLSYSYNADVDMADHIAR